MRLHKDVVIGFVVSGSLHLKEGDSEQNASESYGGGVSALRPCSRCPSLSVSNAVKAAMEKDQFDTPSVKVDATSALFTTLTARDTSASSSTDGLASAKSIGLRFKPA
jgi:hypothetical protein